MAISSVRIILYCELSFLLLVVVWLIVVRRRVKFQTAVLQKKLEQEESLKEAAEAANRTKSAFLASMSHEIRTPMNAILGYCQLMLLDASLGTDARRNLNIISRSGEHLLDLLNDILVMSKIEAGRMELNPVPFDVSLLTEDLSAMFRLRALSKGLTLEVGLDGDVGQRIVADQGKLRQVLINLLGNAVKFTERGGIKLHVSLNRRAGSQLWLSVRVEDSGVGIAPGEQDKLFRPFVQTQSGLASQGGTGLGLAISREFVELMGGTIAVTSALGKGSTFRFDVPVQASGRPAVPGQTELDRPCAAEAASETTKSMVALACALRPERLAQLPAASLDQLHSAVLDGDKDRLDVLIEAAAERDAGAARALKELADKYEYDALMRWLEEARQTGPPAQK